MASFCDGPASAKFQPLPLKGNCTFSSLAKKQVSEYLREHVTFAPTGECVCWGIPFHICRPILLQDKPVKVFVPTVKARWLVFLHTSDIMPLEWNDDGFISPMRGQGRMGEHAADYVVRYADGSEERVAIKRRFQVGLVTRHWGENCFLCVPHAKPHPVLPMSEQQSPKGSWGQTQTRVATHYYQRWMNWLWAWENPHPEKPIIGFRFVPVCGTLVISAISAGTVTEHPLRWESRKKAVLHLPKGTSFNFQLDEKGLYSQIQLDLGQVISAQARCIYPNATWSRSYNNQCPEISESEVVVEYTAHPEAEFHVLNKRIPAKNLRQKIPTPNRILTSVRESARRVRLRVLDKTSGKPVPVKLHVHGEVGEYLAPVDRHRIPNTAWFEDYSCDFANQNKHFCTYISGETLIDLPLGKVFIEISKGFEIRPIRKVLRVTKGTEEIVLTLEKVLPWREKNWVTADTHVHFLSPPTARLEGAAEGVNVVNLLASQWGELMTNVGDFDGATVFGSKEAGGDGEYLVRVGTENRQNVMGHISLLGYSGPIIAPMTTAGPDESALGDPVGALLTEWARQCHKQGGLVVLPHFPNPRCEHVAAIIDGSIDAIEMTSWGNLYFGIDPYSLSDWYRYLNNGYFLPAVGGTDKMSANTAVGTVRTYAQLREDEEFSYDNWMRAVKAGRTFATYGPLLEFSVEGQPSGSRIAMSPTGGTVTVSWHVASVTLPMTRVDLVVNGAIKESRHVRPWEDSGEFTLRVDRSSWAAILVRGKYRDKPEMIGAHSSPVMIEVAGSPFYAAADALTLLEQIEGALAYLDTLGTRAETAAYKRMRLVLTAAHRSLHNRMHQHGMYHDHTVQHDHDAHHKRQR
ncbi:MAG TPA: CehA/McbA family metallohydrolase [Candidatus Hydrogenedentes bacterium]|nr:CehA/McbA family metallohydrolase [Candidatus Hydrogenedentota bacterium]HOL76345.1 CehA/McbA family metallohydrolase [Candidatus Hydrogenedentota bacterium]HPO86172.1 CehA/McbA family metallohydrolase [Candidatus Hydrogenedentota bacterium]